MQPKLRLMIRNHTKKEEHTYKKIKDFQRKLEELLNYEKYYVRLEIRNFKKPKKEIKHTMNDFGGKIKMTGQVMIKEILKK